MNKGEVAQIILGKGVILKEGKILQLAVRDMGNEKENPIDYGTFVFKNITICYRKVKNLLLKKSHSDTWGKVRPPPVQPSIGRDNNCCFWVGGVWK